MSKDTGGTVLHTSRDLKEVVEARESQAGGSHYTEMLIQPWDVIDTWPVDQRIGYYRGCALKYLMRMGAKDESAQEIAKGRHCMAKLIETLAETPPPVDSSVEYA